MREEIKTFLTTLENSYDAIIFYKELRAELEKNLSDEIKNLIAQKIPSYSNLKVIKLNPLKVPSSNKRNCNRLAAASTELKPKMTTKTFVDNDKEYLIKVLNYGETTKVFVFSTKDEIVKDFDIIIEPNNLKYHFEDNSEPLKIEQSIEADKIEIRFN